MKANEVKSKFIYPNKLYARTNDNITLDISYAPQTIEAVEYVRTDAFIEKTATWFANRYQANGSYLNANDIEDFKKAMKGE